MSGKPVKPTATKNRPAAVGFVTQAFAVALKHFEFVWISTEEIKNYLILY
jgi:hypothetical protein